MSGGAPNKVAKRLRAHANANGKAPSHQRCLNLTRDRWAMREVGESIDAFAQRLYSVLQGEL